MVNAVVISCIINMLNLMCTSVHYCIDLSEELEDLQEKLWLH